MFPFSKKDRQILEETKTPTLDYEPTLEDYESIIRGNTNSVKKLTITTTDGYKHVFIDVANFAIDHTNTCFIVFYNKNRRSLFPICNVLRTLEEGEE